MYTAIRLQIKYQIWIFWRKLWLQICLTYLTIILSKHNSFHSWNSSLVFIHFKQHVLCPIFQINWKRYSIDHVHLPHKTWQYISNKIHQFHVLLSIYVSAFSNFVCLLSWYLSSCGKKFLSQFMQILVLYIMLNYN